MVDVDTKSLILDWRFSPKIQDDEKRVIDDLAMRVLRRDEISLNLPLKPDESFARMLKIRVRQPFAREEGLPDLFSDLQ